MGKRGPKPKPMPLKVADGTYRADRDGDASLQVTPPPAVNLDPPESLGEVGRAKWREVAPILSDQGLFTELDRGALATYCRAHDEIAKCDEILAKEGEEFETDKGFVGQHPAVNRRFKWLEIKRKYEAPFGMTPSDRNGLVGNKPKAGGVKTRKRTG